MNRVKTVLSIAGSDPSGGAGIQADIKTMCANGVYAMTAITALTAQNTMGVSAIYEVTPQFLAKQLDSVFEDIFPDAVKIGMVPTSEHAELIAEKLISYKAKNIVFDPVMVATSGSLLAKGASVKVLCREILPYAALVTPNIPEAEVLSGMAIKTESDMEKAARIIFLEYGCNVLVKGGHGTKDANDLLYIDGVCKHLCAERIDNPNTHGTGCTLSSAIASNLAKGYQLTDAVVNAKQYISGCISAMLDLGKGRGPLQHMNVSQGRCDRYC